MLSLLEEMPVLIFIGAIIFNLLSTFLVASLVYVTNKENKHTKNNPGTKHAHICQNPGVHPAIRTQIFAAGSRNSPAPSANDSA